MQRPIQFYIDHTLLRFDATKENIQKLCEEALQHKFASVCIPPYLLEIARKRIPENSSTKVTTVVGFPFGYTELSVKINECKSSIDDGADELDVVVNISAVKSKDWDRVESEIDAIATSISMKDKKMKLILETGIMNRQEIERLCELCLKYKVHYAKTSTGYNGKGVDFETVVLMKELLKNKVKIKASGGINSLDEIKKYIELGADRIGTSKAMEFFEEKQ